MDVINTRCSYRTIEFPMAITVKPAAHAIDVYVKCTLLNHLVKTCIGKRLKIKENCLQNQKRKLQLHFYVFMF